MKQEKKTPWIAPALTAVCVIPFLYLFARSFLREGQLSLMGYYRVFLGEGQYLQRFWMSLLLAGAIACGQVVVSVLAGYGFAKCRFPGRDVTFFLLMLLMIMPLQVTLVPNYLMLEQLGLLDTYYALALPMMFVPLGTFIMTQCFRAVPNDIIEAARLDGCGTLGVICRIVAPMNKSGIICTMLLSFLDGWNMVEQPLVYLTDFDRYPIAVGLAFSPPGEVVTQMVTCILVVIPPLFLFAYYKKELVEGIAIGGEK